VVTVGELLDVIVREHSTRSIRCSSNPPSLLSLIDVRYDVAQIECDLIDVSGLIVVNRHGNCCRTFSIIIQRLLIILVLALVNAN